MIWNNHKELEGKHAFMGASQFRWINWDDQTFEERYYGQFAQDIGTTLHALAHDMICSRTKMKKSDRSLIDIYLYKAYIPKSAYDAEGLIENLAQFINDAIGFHMSSEVLLYYSLNCFGTADAIYFSDKEKILRIHDYKSGATQAHIEQLMIYTALFCLEYNRKPQDFKTVLRIYQNDGIVECEPDYMEIEKFMKMIKDRDNYINIMKGVKEK